MKGIRKEGPILAAITVSMVIIVVKGLGFVKQAVIASFLGASVETDTYFLAFSIIGGISQAIFSAVSINLIPQYLNEKKNNNKESFISSVVIVFCFIALIITILIVFFADILSMLVADNMNQEYLAYCLRVEAIICICYGIINIFGAVLEAEKNFIPLRLNGIFISVFIIGALFISDKKNVNVVLWATVLANIFEVAYMYLCVRRHIKFKQFSIEWEKMKILVELTIPLIVGNAVIQLNSIIDKILAIRVSEGGATCLNYGQILYDFVNATLIVSLASIAFSYFSDDATNNNVTRICSNLSKAIKYMIIALLPISIFSIIKAEDIVTLIYARGNFNAKNVSDCAKALQGYSIGFVFVAVRELLVKVHYAFQDTKRPMCNGMISIIFNIALSVLLSLKWQIFGIAIATSIAAFIGMVLSLVTVKTHILKEKIIEKTFITKMVVIYLCLIIFTYVIEIWIQDVTNLITSVVLTCGLMIIGYIMLLFVFNITEAKQLIRYVLRFVKKVKG